MATILLVNNKHTFVYTPFLQGIHTHIYVNTESGM